jgi:integrase
VPRIARELAPAEVARITKPGTHAVGGVTGLCLQVTGSGSRTWLLRIKVGSRRREFGLGSAPTVALSTARDKARTLREKLGGGLDPVVQRRAARTARSASNPATVPFKACAEAFVAAEVASGRNARHAAQVLLDLERLAFPLIGRQSVRTMTTALVLSVVESLWKSKFATATKLRGNIERVLKYGIANGFRDEPNPARWTDNLDNILLAPKVVRRGERHPSLPVDELPAFVAELRSMPGVAARALEMMILTTARPSDVRSMSWHEVDFDAKLWTISADRAQGARSHRVPLTGRALELLSARPRTTAQALVFAAPRSGIAMSDMTLTAVVRRMNAQREVRGQQPWVDPGQNSREVVPHGFRVTFRAWAERANYSNHLIDTALGQGAVPKARDNAGRTDYLGERTSMMTAWSQQCSGSSTPRVNNRP